MGWEEVPVEYIGPDGNPMVPLVCELCGEQIGLRTAGPAPNPELVIARCYGCAATEEAERITGDAA